MPAALVVGAGIGGLAAGIALRRAGWDVRVLERSAAPRDVGFGLGLAGNAMAALRELGLADEVRAHSLTPTVGEIRHTHGRVIRRFEGRLAERPAGDVPAVILRPVLHRILLDALASHGVSVELQRGAERFERAGPGVRAMLTDGTIADADILVGADGVASTIRAQLHPAEPPPAPSGYVAVRGLSRAVSRLNGVQFIWYFGPGIESGIVQAGPNEIYWFLSLLKDVVMPGPLDVPSVMSRVTSGFDPQFHAVTSATAPDDQRFDELFVRDPLRRWGDGPVTLLGDAAHPVLPHTGQGAAQSLEDAVALGRTMNGAVDYSAALRRYEEIRSRASRKVVKAGPRIARMTTTKNPVIAFLRNSTIRLVPEFLIVRVFSQTRRRQ